MDKGKDVVACWRLWVAGAALLACAGCASTAYLNLDSDPGGAVIRTHDGVRLGTAPVSVRLGTIPLSAYQGTNAWTPGKTYVAWKDGYEPAYWSPRLSLAGVTRALGLPHTWDHVFVLSPKAVEVVETPSSSAPSAEPPPAAPTKEVTSQAPRQMGPSDAPPSSTAKGTVSVTAEPDNAEIFVDGQFIGNSPATLRLPEGKHVVEVKKDGLRAYRQEVHMTGESELTLRVRLQP
jgi:hypothetical protein